MSYICHQVVITWQLNCFPAHGVVSENMRDKLSQMYGIGIFAFILFLSTLIGVPVLPKLSHELGASDTVIPIIVSASLITVVLAQFFTGILADRWSKRMLILIGVLLGSVSSLLVIFCDQLDSITAAADTGRDC